MSAGWIIFIVATTGFHYGLLGMFKKAGFVSWKALVPYYNTWIMVEKMPLKKHWFYLQFIPIVGQFISIWIYIKFVEHFGRFSLLHHTAAVFLPFIYFPYLGYSKNERYAGNAVVRNYKKSSFREWVDAATFAVVAASIIRTFIFEAYVIPSGSMEKTLLVNDFLFVSKMSYGPRLPNTPLAIPFVHHTLPLVGSRSYLNWIKIPYRRLWSNPIKRNDVVVFNLPVGDTVVEAYQLDRNYYDILREDYKGNREELLQRDDITIRPIDKRENIIKRCIAIAGDTLMITNGNVFVNGQNAGAPLHGVTDYYVKTTSYFDPDELEKDFNLDIAPERFQVQMGDNKDYMLKLSESEADRMQSRPNVQSLTKIIHKEKDYKFPYDTVNYKWNEDFFGPVCIPQKGATVQLNSHNIALYKRIIEVYEQNSFQQTGEQFKINGTETKEYTFKMNYYWVMGDNRHNSQDSRFWGFLPEDHIVGKASLIWWSWKSGPRWNRIFSRIQ